jgi:hypothetical protein
MDIVDNFPTKTLVIAYVASNLVAILMVFCSWRLPQIGRVLYALLFGWASWKNATTSLRVPEVYREYARYAFLSVYRNFIEGFFAQHITLGFIAACQGLIALSMLFKGRIFQLGAMGGIVFLVAIAPLGFGSAFPCTLVMALGLGLLLRQQSRSVWSRAG